MRPLKLKKKNWFSAEETTSKTSKVLKWLEKSVDLPVYKEVSNITEFMMWAHKLLLLVTSGHSPELGHFVIQV